MSLARALAGIRVLDLSRLLPGPYLTMVLADMGADVVKVEAPVGGDYLRHMPPLHGDMSGRFLAINRNKRSLTLDLKSDAGRAAFLRMVTSADVVVESFRPGVMARLGLDYPVLLGANPRLILCSISGFGQTGPYRDKAGHDLNYVAMTGALAMGGARAGSPAMPGAQVADIAGGALWSATGIVSALFQRERTGAGAHLDISMTEGVLAMMAAELASCACGPSEPAPSRGNQALNGGLACYRIYQARDGKYLAVGALEPKFWLALQRAIGRDGDANEVAAGPAEQERIADELAAIFRTRDRDDWVEHLAAHDCCCEPVLELDEVSEHPLHQQRAVFFDLDGSPAEEGGPRATLRQLRTPLGAPERRQPAPRQGQHSRAVLAEYGFGEGEIDQLIGT
ncbi:MAG: CaiB/BaiF CoA-transferase family protein [Haliangiales bacterium]